jgi:hypothetical protein
LRADRNPARRGVRAAAGRRGTGPDSGIYVNAQPGTKKFYRWWSYETTELNAS